MKVSGWLRVIHRDLGFFVIGITLIYGISGILLNHLNDKDPAFETKSGIVQLSPQLQDDELIEAWNSKSGLPAVGKVMRIDETHYRLMFKGGIGVYNVNDGRTDFEQHRKRVLIYWLNRLHYNKVKGWTPIADMFAVSLLFLAVSGLFIVKGKRGLAGRGKWYLLAGLLIPLVYVLLL